jgi:hypothetical protein
MSSLSVRAGGCHPGWGFGAFGLVQNATLFNGGMGHLSVQTELVPDEYFWAQCSLPNEGSALLMMGAIAAAAAVLSALMGAIFPQRPKRAISELPLI